jgi:hypothetical protein
LSLPVARKSTTLSNQNEAQEGRPYQSVTKADLYNAADERTRAVRLRVKESGADSAAPRRFALNGSLTYVRAFRR